MLHEAKTINNVSFLVDTDPYEDMSYVVHTAKPDTPDEEWQDGEFVCFDFQNIWINGRRYLFLCALVNSEVGHFIEDGGEDLTEVPPETTRDQLYQHIETFVFSCCDWFGENEMPVDFKEMEGVASNICTDVMHDARYSLLPPNGREPIHVSEFISITAACVEEAISAFLSYKDNGYAFANHPDGLNLIAYPSERNIWDIKLDTDI